MLLYKEVGRRSARQQPAETQAVAHSSGMVLEDLTQRRTHGKFPETRPPDFATDAKQLRASIFGEAQASEPIRALVHDVVNIAKRFHILDDRRSPPEPANLGEGRLRSRMRSLPFECIQQSRLFATDVTPSAGWKMNFKTVARPEDVAAKIIACFCFGDRSAEAVVGALVLASQKYVTDIGLNRVCGDDHAFDQLVRIPLHQRAVLERSRLHLVGVRNEVLWMRSLLSHGYEAPLHAGGKAGPSPPAKIRSLHQFGDLRRLHSEGLAEPLISTCALLF